jgi:hypothetical protein
MKYGSRKHFVQLAEQFSKLPIEQRAKRLKPFILGGALTFIEYVDNHRGGKVPQKKTVYIPPQRWVMELIFREALKLK